MDIAFHCREHSLFKYGHRTTAKRGTQQGLDSSVQVYIVYNHPQHADDENESDSDIKRTLDDVSKMKKESLRHLFLQGYLVIMFLTHDFPTEQRVQQKMF